MQEKRHGGKEINQTKRAEDIPLAAFPGPALCGRELGPERPHPHHIFQREKHHAPKFQLMEKIFVLGVYFGDGVQNHGRTIDQDHDRDHPFHIAADGVLGRAVQHLHHGLLQALGVYRCGHVNSGPDKKRAPAGVRVGFQSFNGVRGCVSRFRLHSRSIGHLTVHDSRKSQPITVGWVDTG